MYQAELNTSKDTIHTVVGTSDILESKVFEDSTGEEHSVEWSHGKKIGTTAFAIVGFIGLGVVALGVCSHFHVGALATWAPKMAEALHLSKHVMDIAVMSVGSALAGGSIAGEAIIHRRAIGEGMSDLSAKVFAKRQHSELNIGEKKESVSTEEKEETTLATDENQEKPPVEDTNVEKKEEEPPVEDTNIEEKKEETIEDKLNNLPSLTGLPSLPDTVVTEIKEDEQKDL